MSDQYKYLLSEKDIPEAWYNINPDMPVNPAETAWNAVLHPVTKEPATPEFLSVLFPMRRDISSITNSPSPAINAGSMNLSFAANSTFGYLRVKGISSRPP